MFPAIFHRLLPCGTQTPLKPYLYFPLCPFFKPASHPSRDPTLLFDSNQHSSFPLFSLLLPHFLLRSPFHFATPSRLDQKRSLSFESSRWSPFATPSNARTLSLALPHLNSTAPTPLMANLLPSTPTTSQRHLTKRRSRASLTSRKRLPLMENTERITFMSPLRISWLTERSDLSR